MEHAVAVASNISEESQSTRDILAMLSMLDYLIAQTSPIDAISARCLVLARESLAAAATRRTELH
jgi:hypothetical protein